MPVSEATLSASPARPQLQTGTGWPGAEQPVHRHPDMAKLARHPGGSAHHLAGLDHSAAQAGAHDRRHRGAPHRLLRPEMLVMGIEGGRIGIVVIHNGQPEADLQRAADIKSAPLRIREVGGSLGSR